jgi:hypothetical protein
MSDYTPDVYVTLGETLESFIARTTHMPDEAIVQAQTTVFTRRPDGTFGTPVFTLGRLREELSPSRPWRVWSS